MVVDELTDGKRIGQLLASEVHGHERDFLGDLKIVDAAADVEPAEAGAFAFAIAFDADGPGSSEDDRVAEHDRTVGDDRISEEDRIVEDDRIVVDPRIAEAYVHPDRLRVEFTVAVETAAEAATRAGLRVRPKAAEPPRTLVFAERGADVKAALAVVRAVAADVLENRG